MTLPQKWKIFSSRGLGNATLPKAIPCEQKVRKLIPLTNGEPSEIHCEEGWNPRPGDDELVDTASSLAIRTRRNDGGNLTADVMGGVAAA
jgi:hypothetical protein